MKKQTRPKVLVMPMPDASKRLLEVMDNLREDAKAGKITNFVCSYTKTEAFCGSAYWWDRTRSSMTELIGEMDMMKDWCIGQLRERMDDDE